MDIEMEKIRSAEFWRDLCPDLNLRPEMPLAEMDLPGTRPFTDGHWEQCKELVNTDGYFATEPRFEPELIQRLSSCLQKLEQHGLIPGFCFVYDEFWMLLRGLDPILSDLLDDYLLLPAVWAWIVRDSKQTGFKPHRDQIRDVAPDEEEHLDYLTIWIPLTDINHLSSCISLVPATRDPDYDAGTEQVVVGDLQDIRTLQGPAGSVFAWATGLIHWGTRQSQFGPPRISVAYYVQKADAEVLDPPVLDPQQPLSLEQRLQIIGEQIYNYARDESPELAELSRLLITGATED